MNWETAKRIYSKQIPKLKETKKALPVEITQDAESSPVKEENKLIILFIIWQTRIICSTNYKNMEKSGDSLHLHHSATSSSEVSPVKPDYGVDFLKQTNDMQKELNRLSKLSSSNLPKVDDSDSMSGSQWSQINDILEKHGLSVISIYRDDDMQEFPDLKSLSEIMWELLAEYSAKKKEIDEYKDSVKKLRRENKDLKRKKHKVAHKPDTNLFRSFMKREFDPESSDDSRITDIIAHYEDQKKRLLEEYRNFKEEMERSQKYLKHFQGDLEIQKRSLERNPKADDILTRIQQDLSISTIEDIPDAVHKLQQVCLSLPNVEKFIEVVCKATGHTKNFDQEKTVSTILNWKAEHTKLGEILDRLDTKEHPEALEKAEAISHFCNLFEVSGIPVKVVVEQVYYFVHEIKLFLGFARKSLGLNQGSSVTKVLEEISKSMKYDR